MGSVNLHIVIGIVGQKPVIRTTPKGVQVCELSVATDDGDKNPDGSKKANWHKLICFGKTAEFVSTYIDKGVTICAQGKVKLREWEKRDGSGKGYTKETIVDKIEALSRTQKNENPPSYQPPQGGNNPPPQPANAPVGNSQFAPNQPLPAIPPVKDIPAPHQQVPDVTQPPAQNIPAPTREIPPQVPMNAESPPPPVNEPPMPEDDLPF